MAETRQRAVTKTHFDDSIAGLRREIESGDAQLRGELMQLEERIMLRTETHDLTHVQIDTLLARLDTKMDRLLDWRTQAIADAAQERGRDAVLARILAAAVVVLTSVVAYLITRAL